jgi:PIN domain nuclease of toxin-antitoxin system
VSWSRALLLDTNAAIFLAAGQLPDTVVERLVFAGLADGVFVSPISAWEVGLLAQRSPGMFGSDPAGWFDRLLSKPIIKLAPLSPSAAIASADLPGVLHRDPADRMLIASAREMGVPLVTRDTKIIAYAAAGFVDVLPC